MADSRSLEPEHAAVATTISDGDGGDDDGGGGYKLVTDDYLPLSGEHRGGGHRYTVGSTQWIVWDDCGGTRPPPAPKLCSALALHYCARAVDTLMFATTMPIDGLRLLRVTPVRWSEREGGGGEGGKGGSDDAAATPLFVTARKSDQAKRGAHGLRVDAEVTDPAMRCALLTGQTTPFMFQPRAYSTHTFDNGKSVAFNILDMMGNLVSVTTDIRVPKLVGCYVMKSRLIDVKTGKREHYKFCNYETLFDSLFDMDRSADEFRGGSLDRLMTSATLANADDDAAICFVAFTNYPNDKWCRVKKLYTKASLRHAFLSGMGIVRP